jgi:transcriptional regulator with XRE-family HTH domain
MEINIYELADFLREKLNKAIADDYRSAAQIAKEADIDTVSIYRLQSGKRNLNQIDTLYKLAKALNKPITYFFGETNIADNSQNLSTEDIITTDTNSSQIITGSNIKGSNVNYNSDNKAFDPKIQQLIDLLPFARPDMIDDLINTLSQIKELQEKYKM